MMVKCSLEKIKQRRGIRIEQWGKNIVLNRMVREGLTEMFCLLAFYNIFIFFMSFILSFLGFLHQILFFCLSLKFSIPQILPLVLFFLILHALLNFHGFKYVHIFPKDDHSHDLMAHSTELPDVSIFVACKLFKFNIYENNLNIFPSKPSTYSVLPFL